MRIRIKRRALAVVALGLLGTSALLIVERVAAPSFPAHDFVRGLWVGPCLGLEILGLICLGRLRPKIGA